MKAYHVQWCIDLAAESPRDAAEKALEIMRDQDSTATVFIVTKHDNGTPKTIDLQE